VEFNVMKHLSAIRTRYRIGALGAAGILGLCLVGMTHFIGAGAQSRYQATVDAAFDARASAKNLLIRLLELRHHKRDYALRRDAEYRDEWSK
jgi:hypothetical protein